MQLGCQVMQGGWRDPHGDHLMRQQLHGVEAHHVTPEGGRQVHVGWQQAPHSQLVQATPDLGQGDGGVAALGVAALLPATKGERCRPSPDTDCSRHRTESGGVAVTALRCLLPGERGDMIRLYTGRAGSQREGVS